MKNLLILGGVIFVAILAASFFYNQSKISSPRPTASVTSQNSNNEIPNNLPKASDSQTVAVVAEGLDTPWAIAFLPDKSMLVTERGGIVRLVDSSGKLQETPVATLSQVKEIGEGGLLGIALHPNFSSNKFVYLYYTYRGSGNNTLNRVVRMTYKDNEAKLLSSGNKLSDEKILIDQIPGASNHNGGRIKFGPDKFLYITTGDAAEPSQAQDKNSLAGKILRVTDEGKATPGNPFNNLVYSYGHRNPQGIAWDSDGQLWETEHGPSGGSLGTGNDEVNRIEIGKNYGWPIIQGDQTRDGMVRPIRHSGRDATWAPGGAAFYRNSLVYGGLRGQALYQGVIESNQVKEFKEHFKGEYGRIREVILGPDNMLYITTSNKDGRGSPRSSDDKIIKINPAML